MPVNLQADLKAFDQELERLADLHPEVAGKTLRRQVVLLAIDIMERTPPGIGIGLSNNAKKEGQNAVFRDISRVYQSAKKLSASEIATANNFSYFQKWAEATGSKIPPALRDYSLAITGKADTIDKIISGKSAYDFEQFKRLFKSYASPGSISIQSGFNKSFHLQAKGSRGRVPDDFRPMDFFVKTNGVAAYRREVAARVGKLKAGWFAAIRSLPEGKNHRKIPAWIKAAVDDSSGYSEDYSSDPRMVASVAIANRIADKNRVSTRVSAISNAVQFRARMMRREYAEALKDLAAKASRK